MQQSSATQSLHLSFWGLRKIVACSHSSSQCLLVSTVFGTVSSLHPTSFLYIWPGTRTRILKNQQTSTNKSHADTSWWKKQHNTARIFKKISPTNRQCQEAMECTKMIIL